MCRSGTVATDELSLALTSESAAVVNEEAGGTGELVALLGQDPDGQLLAGHARQVRAGQLEGLGQLRLVHVDRTGLCLGPSGLQFLDRIFIQLVDIAATRGVVVSRHAASLLSGGIHVFVPVGPGLMRYGLSPVRPATFGSPVLCPRTDRISNRTQSSAAERYRDDVSGKPSGRRRHSRGPRGYDLAPWSLN